MGKTNRAQHNLDDYTFGKRIEEVILAKNLREYGNRKDISKIGKLISHYRIMLKNISEIKEPRVRAELLKMSRDKYDKRICDMKTNPNIETFVRNLLKIYYKEFSVKGKLNEG